MRRGERGGFCGGSESEWPAGLSVGSVVPLCATGPMVSGCVVGPHPVSTTVGTEEGPAGIFVLHSPAPEPLYCWEASREAVLVSS